MNAGRQAGRLNKLISNANHGHKKKTSSRKKSSLLTGFII